MRHGRLSAAARFASRAFPQGGGGGHNGPLHGTPLTALALSLTRFLPALFCALAATAAETPAVFWASSPTRPGEHVLPPVPEGAAAVMLRTSFTLGRELDMGFNRMDDYTDVYLDGKPLIPRMRRDWFWRNSDLTLRLDAGRHELTLIRLLKPEKAPRANEDDLRLQWWVPVALRPGDISFEVGCNPQKTKTFSAAVKN